MRSFAFLLILTSGVGEALADQHPPQWLSQILAKSIPPGELKSHGIVYKLENYDCAATYLVCAITCEPLTIFDGDSCAKTTF